MGIKLGIYGRTFMSLDDNGRVGSLFRCRDACGSDDVGGRLRLADSFVRCRFRRRGNCRRALRAVTATATATAPSASPFATFLAVCVRHWWNGARGGRRRRLGYRGLGTSLAWRLLSLRTRFRLAFIAAIVATGILSFFTLAGLRCSLAGIACRCLRQCFAAALVTPLSTDGVASLGEHRGQQLRG